MLSWEDDVEARALRGRGWSISAIARHLGHDRKTVRAYLRGDRVPGQRASRGLDVMAPFADYCRIRLADDPHLWASALLDELRELGYAGSYPTGTIDVLIRALRLLLFEEEHAVGVLNRELLRSRRFAIGDAAH